MKRKKFFPQPYMPVWSQGPAVALIQIALLCMGYGRGKVVVNGVHDEETAKAVKAFQRDQRIQEDGCVGPETRENLWKITTVDVNSFSAGQFYGPTTVPIESVADSGKSVAIGAVVAESSLVESAA
ncbi:MAG: peptidoglycan-binding domain-containing protein [Candidatus Paceibacterota bacterium]|jgi:peptidoglycan hydrolase-like protein with peptidoglycan-binding domain